MERVVAIVGDGINDVSALAHADTNRQNLFLLLIYSSVLIPISVLCLLDPIFATHIIAISSA